MTTKEKSKYINISDGASNGFVVFYLKGGKLYPVLLTDDQAAMLDIVLAVPFTGGATIHSQPVELAAIKGMIKN